MTHKNASNQVTVSYIALYLIYISAVGIVFLGFQTINPCQKILSFGFGFDRAGLIFTSQAVVKTN
jgi:small-conductance mechanosensitive channel